jgi:hypothetical protein
MAALVQFDIDKIYVGTDIVVALYIGEELVWIEGGSGFDMFFVPDECDE